jgi:hypothetical protein
MPRRWKPSPKTSNKAAFFGSILAANFYPYRVFSRKSLSLSNIPAGNRTRI